MLSLSFEANINQLVFLLSLSPVWLWFVCLTCHPPRTCSPGHSTSQLPHGWTVLELDWSLHTLKH
jgi:hypothetical protein